MGRKNLLVTFAALLLAVAVLSQDGRDCPDHHRRHDRGPQYFTISELMRDNRDINWWYKLSQFSYGIHGRNPCPESRGSAGGR